MVNIELVCLMHLKLDCLYYCLTHPKIAIKRLSSKTFAINRYKPSMTQPIGSAYSLMIGVPNLVVKSKT